MALRFRLCTRDQLPAYGLGVFTVPGVTWPVLAGVIDGELIATAGVCPHEDVSLAGGTLEGACLTCPGHGYQFDLRTGACTHDPDLWLRRYKVSVDPAGEVWIELL
jgi:nitrite reductase/ring-hydroxylating ferredoxin subunit